MSDKTPIEEFVEVELTEIYHEEGLTYDLYSRLYDRILELEQNYVTKEQHKEDVIEAYIHNCESKDYYQEAEQYYNENHKQ